jgi:hypothetical protein
MNILELYEPPIGQHDVLNPKLWEARGVLKSEVQGALLRIAEDFLEFCEVDVDVVDTVITGGNANYTYTSHSDIDLHIVADLSQVACDREVNELFDTKRLLYREQRDVDIHKIPVELYVEDVRTPAVSGGCYSILKKTWVKRPIQADFNYDEVRVKELVDKWHTLIKQAIKHQDAALGRRIMDLVRKFRQRGLNTAQGEFSVPNLVFKSLRNDESIRQLQHLLDIDHNSRLSV